MQLTFFSKRGNCFLNSGTSYSPSYLLIIKYYYYDYKVGFLVYMFVY